MKSPVRKLLLRSLLLTAVAMLLFTTSYAQTGVLTGDAHTQNSTPNQNFGDNVNLRLGSGINSYIKFDLSTLPAGTSGSDIARATVRLWINTITAPGSFDVYRITGGWDEAIITSNIAPTLGSVQLAGVSISAGAEDSFLSIDITTLVRDWIDGAIANNGIALVRNPAGISVRFDSKENETTSHEPRLEITRKSLAAVSHNGTLSGGGTSGDPLTVANQGVGNSHLADGAVSGAKIGSGQVVKSLNGLRDDVTLAAGSNVTITPSGNTLTIASAGGLSAVSHNATLSGDGTSGSPLSVAIPMALSGSSASGILLVNNSGTGPAIAATGAINTTAQYNINGQRIVSNPGTNNMFLGVGAGAANTAGMSNSFFGQSAGQANTTGGDNAFFGFRAGVPNTTGAANSFFGSKAGQANSTGGFNSFFGSGAGESNTTGGTNAFFGHQAGQQNTTGFKNAFVGFHAGHNNTTGIFNTFVGPDAGTSNTVENNNTFVGFNSNGAVGIFNATAVGADTNVGCSNCLVLGNNANVGIGVSNPTFQLQLSLDSAAKPTSNTWTIASDARLKKDIRPFSDGLAILRLINPVSYKLNGKAGMKADTPGIGVIAQQVRDIIPYTISTFQAKLDSKDAAPTELLSFNSSALTFVTINAVKELSAQVDNKEREITGLKQEVADLKARLVALEAMMKKFVRE